MQLTFRHDEAMVIFDLVTYLGLQAIGSFNFVEYYCNHDHDSVDTLETITYYTTESDHQQWIVQAHTLMNISIHCPNAHNFAMGNMSGEYHHSTYVRQLGSFFYDLLL